MSETRLTPQQLVELRATGHSAGQSPFVDPYIISQSLRVLDRRGERWAAAVLGRDISRRSLAVPARPYLRSGEPDTLVLADAAEDTAAISGLT